MKWLLTLALLLAPLAPAYAISKQNSKQDSFMLTPDVMPLPKVSGAVIPWQVFLTTKEKERKLTLPDGSYTFEVTPEFSDTVKALDGKEAQLYGFMFPMEQSEQMDFLFGPYPLTCPFHYHVTPSLIVGVKAKKKIAFSWDEITIKGTLKLVENDPNGVFYMLQDAEEYRSPR